MLSRVADNLYWMSRYLERAEHTSRLIAVKLESMIEQSKEDADRSWRRVVAALSGEAFVSSTMTDAFEITNELAFELLNPSSLVSSLRLARDNGRQVREQISTELWNHLNQLYLRLTPLNMRALWNDQPASIFRETIEQLHMLEGIAYSTMRHGEGWHFIQLGRYIERAQLVSRLLDLHFGAASRAGTAPKEYDDSVLLKCCTAFEAYCKVYTATIRRDRVAEFLLFDAEFLDSEFGSNRYRVSAVFHGHAHRGSLEGRTSTGVPVHNVAMPLLARTNPNRPPFLVVEVPLNDAQAATAKADPAREPLVKSA